MLAGSRTAGPPVGRSRPFLRHALRLGAVLLVVAGPAATAAAAPSQTAVRVAAVGSVATRTAPQPSVARTAAAPENAEAGPDAKYYVCEVTVIEPRVPGLTVTVLRSGRSITVTNGTGKEVVVLGYAGEDYLRIGNDTVQENANSLTAALNRDQGRAGLPEQFTGRLTPRPPQWRTISDSNSITWQDYRTRWSAADRPPIVRADPHREVQVLGWAIQTRVADETALIRGAVTWTGTPRIGRLTVVTIAAATVLALAAVLLLFWRGRRARAGALNPDEVSSGDGSVSGESGLALLLGLPRPGAIVLAQGRTAPVAPDPGPDAARYADRARPEAEQASDTQSLNLFVRPALLKDPLGQAPDGHEATSGSTRG